MSNDVTVTDDAEVLDGLGLDERLLQILACPNCHAALAVDHDARELVCGGPGCGLAYPVRHRIPVLLIDEARRPD